jgi:hypothetical protein
MVRGLLLALLCWSATASADPVDVHVSVDVHVDAATTPVVHRTDPPHRYLAFSEAAGPNGMGGYRVDLDLAQGPTWTIHAGQLYSVFGATLARTTATPMNFESDDELALRDDSAVAYAAIGARVGRLDGRWYAGAGFERTTGTQHNWMMDGTVDRIDPVGQIGGTIYLRIAGPIALVGGGAIVVHAEKYGSLDTSSSPFWRAPDAQVFGGLAAITD